MKVTLKSPLPYCPVGTEGIPQSNDTFMFNDIRANKFPYRYSLEEIRDNPDIFLIEEDENKQEDDPIKYFAVHNLNNENCEAVQMILDRLYETNKRIDDLKSEMYKYISKSFPTTGKEL